MNIVSTKTSGTSFVTYHHHVLRYKPPRLQEAHVLDRQESRERDLRSSHYVDLTGRSAFRTLIVLWLFVSVDFRCCHPEGNVHNRTDKVGSKVNEKFGCVEFARDVDNRSNIIATFLLPELVDRGLFALQPNTKVEG